MRILILLLGSLIGMANASAAGMNSIEGRYEVSYQHEPYGRMVGWVEVRKSEQGGMEFEFRIPCGTKVSTRVFRTNEAHAPGGELELVQEGSSLCYTGNNPSFLVLDNTLHLYTSPRIRVPGFDGVYKLTKVND